MRQQLTTSNQKARKKEEARARDGEFKELTVPYWFSSTARRRQQDIEIGDYVRVSGLQHRYELLEILWKYGSVRVRQVGHIESMTMPWNAVTPWGKEIISSKTALRAVGNWLFGGTRVYLLSNPGRILKQRKIHWDRQTCDVEADDGTVFYDIPWDELEFWDPVEYNLPDEPN